MPFSVPFPCSLFSPFCLRPCFSFLFLVPTALSLVALLPCSSPLANVPCPYVLGGQTLRVCVPMTHVLVALWIRVVPAGSESANLLCIPLWNWCPSPTQFRYLAEWSLLNSERLQQSLSKNRSLTCGSGGGCLPCRLGSRRGETCHPWHMSVGRWLQSVLGTSG